MATAFLAACLENLLVAAVCGSRSSGTIGGLLVKQLVNALITTGGGSGTGPGGAMTRQGTNTIMTQLFSEVTLYCGCRTSWLGSMSATLWGCG